MRMFSLSFLVMFLLGLPPTSAQEAARTISLHDLFEISAPAEVYGKAVGPFVFSGRAEVVMEKSTKSDEANPTPTSIARDSTWTLKWDGQGNFHFSRTSLMGPSNLDLIYLDRLFYLRRDHETLFRSVSPQAEFFRWINLPFRDLLAACQRHGYSDESAFTPQGRVNCSETESSKLCLDPTTHLPMQGYFTDNPVSGQNHRVTFSVEPGTAESTQITLPSHSEKPEA